MRCVLLAAVLAGCTPYVGVTTATISGPVTPAEPVAVGRVDIASDRLSPSEAVALDRAIGVAARGGPAALDITLLGGTEAMRREVAGIAAGHGVPERNVSRRAGPGGAAVVLTRRDDGPPCEERSLGTPPGAGGVLGCAALGGLARAVAAPQDLLGRPAVVVVEPPPE